MLHWKRIILTALPVILIVAANGGAQGELVRQEWTRYDVATGPAVGLESDAPGTDRPVRTGARFEPRAGETSVEVIILDDAGRRAAARFMFTDEAGEEITSGDFCRQANLPIPPAAQVLWVHPSLIIHPCPPGGSSGPTVTGVVYAGFYAHTD